MILIILGPKSSIEFCEWMSFKPRFCLFILIELQVDAVSLRTLARDFYYPDVLKQKSAGMSVYEQKDSRKVLKDRLRRFVKKTGFKISSYLETPQWSSKFELRI